MFVKLTPVSGIIENFMIVNDTSRVIRRGAPSCGITYDCHSDDSIGVIYGAREHL